MSPNEITQPVDGPGAAVHGLVLTGGGARAAYQVGVLKGIAQLLPPGSPCPFPVLTGTSAGAVSAVALATDSAHFARAVRAIERIWSGFRVGHVIRADGLSMLRSGLRIALTLVSGGLVVSAPRSLFDNSPLQRLLRERIDLERIPRELYRGHLRAVGIAATDYATARSTTFFAGLPDIEPWQRAAHQGSRTHLTQAHLVASLSIPFLFRPTALDGRYYGDGAMRQIAPLAPAIRLGANRLLIVGVGASVGDAAAGAGTHEPSFGDMFGFMLDSLFSDGVQADIDRIRAFNDLARPRHIEPFVIQPSQDLTAIARRHAGELPRSLRVLLRAMGSGADHDGAQLTSFLLFESGYTRELIELGRSDAVARADALRGFLAGRDADPPRAPAVP